MQRKNMWKEYTEIQQKELEELSVRYKECLDIGKTERECVKLAVEMAKEAGYQDIKDVLKEGKSLKAGDKVQLVGFGTFETSKRAAREGRNPQTGETMKIAASVAPKFKPGKALKDAMN